MAAPTLDEIVDDREHHRFVYERDGHTAELVYSRAGDKLVLIHTGVPDELGGHGVGGALVRAAVATAAQEERTIVPNCPFANRWLREHPDVASTVAIRWPGEHGGR